MSESPSNAGMGAPGGLLWIAAPDAVQCERGGMHDPRTLERMVEGQHIKVSVCRKCDKVA